MKSKLLLLLILFVSTISVSQDIIISFEGVDEVTSNQLNIDKIVIDNLTTGKSITATDDINLNLSKVLSNEIFNLVDVNKGIRKLYPNPVTKDATIEFYSEGNSISTLIVYDIQGKEITKLSRNFEKGGHKVKFEPNKTGVYFLKLLDAGKTYYSKILSTSNQFSKASLVYQEKSLVANKSAKKTTTNTFFTEGDVLRYTATSGNLKASIYDSPTATITYTFSFAENFYKFEPYLIKAEYPSFVNVMFSVTDQNNKGVDYLDNDDFEVEENANKISSSEFFRYVKKINQIPSKQKTVILLDKSFSVKDVLPQIKQAALKLINKIADNQQVAIYTFDDSTVLISDFTNDKAVLEAKINEIQVGFNSTNLNGSIITGLSRIQNKYTLDGIEEGYLVVLTDGDDQSAINTIEEVITARGNKKVFMVGLGEDLNEDKLNQIAYPGNYINAVKADDLEGKFEQITLDMLRFSNSFYWLNYMSPKRNNTHTLTVKAKGNTNTASNGKINEDFSANGFKSVFSGVYANIKSGTPYGLDKIEVIYDGVNNLSSIDLKATTYWANDVPVYDWFIDNTDNFEIIVNEDDNTKAKLNFKTNGYSIDNKLTLKDTENDYEKVINVKILTENPSLDLSVIDLEARKGTFKAEITYNGTSQVNKNGFLLFYGDNPNPTEDILLPNVNTSRFSYEDKLFPGQKYRVKAYAENNQGRGFSKEIEFTTKTDVPYFWVNRVSASALNVNSLKASIRINDYGGLDIIEKGFVWSVNPNPTINDNKIASVLNQIPLIEADINGLSPSTKYYFKAYAINEKGVGYSNETEIKTTEGTINNISIADLNETTSVKAKIKGQFSTFEEVIETGFLWSETSYFPTLENSDGHKKVDFNNTVNNNSFDFVGEVNDFRPSAKYNIRSYVKTSEKISYSESYITVETLTGTVRAKALPLNQLLNESVVTGFKLTHNNFGADVQFAGVCWSESEKPTIEDNDVRLTRNDISDITEYNHILKVENLKPGTIYYLRAFVNNGFETFYSESDFVFKTFSGELITDIDGNIYPTVIIGSQTWMADNLRTTKYFNGTEIMNQTGIRNNTHPNSYIIINNDENLINNFGLLYNGEVLLNLGRGPCPDGWRVPLQDDYRTLFGFPVNNFRGSFNVVKQGYNVFNTGSITGNLRVNFRAVPSGYRRGTTASYLNERALFFTKTNGGNNTHYGYLFDRVEQKIEEIKLPKNGTYASCRCIKE